LPTASPARSPRSSRGRAGRRPARVSLRPMFPLPSAIARADFVGGMTRRVRH
jgi:hypothetical protein